MLQLVRLSFGVRILACRMSPAFLVSLRLIGTFLYILPSYVARKLIRGQSRFADRHGHIQDTRSLWKGYDIDTNRQKCFATTLSSVGFNDSMPFLRLHIGNQCHEVVIQQGNSLRPAWNDPTFINMHLTCFR